MTYLNKIIKLLIENKKFPNYQAERRMDIFLNVLLADFLTEYLGEKVDFVCPEFPLRKKGEYNRSTKLDYLCKTENEVIFVELKTDNKSFSVNQLDIYFEEETWGKWMDKLYDIQKATKDKDKYEHLFKTLKQHELSLNNYKDASIRVLYLSPLLSKKDKAKLKSEGKYHIHKKATLSSFKASSSLSDKEWELISPLFSIPGAELALFEFTKLDA